jgi:uncharacterized membrane-anchored protein YitT (DUF2179 family)
VKLFDVEWTKKDIPTILWVIFAALLYSLGMNLFVKAGNLFPGGYSGLSRLISQTAQVYFNIPISFSLIYFVLNAITAAIVWRMIGHKFVVLSVLFFALSALFTAWIPERPVTNDILLVSVFGGLISGLSMGIVLRNNASSGGTDFIAIVLSSRLNRPTWNLMMGANAVILFLAGLLFGWNQALYSIIYQYVSTQVVNMMHQRYKFTRLDIVTNMPEEVCDAIFHVCRHGVTKIPCEGGYTHTPHWLLVANINTYQLADVIETVHGADPHAFVTINSVDRIIGNYYQKPLE